jgi:hypothetical protein
MDVYQAAEDRGRTEKKGVCLCDLLLSLRVMAVKYKHG